MRLFIPGQGVVDSKVYLVDSAVKDYDKRLMFMQHPETTDWCVFIELPRPERPYPIMGFGDRIPDPGEVVDRLRNSDTMRNGHAVYREVERSQRAYRDRLQYEADQASSEAVEAVEFMMRREGKSPVIKSLSKGVSE